MSDIVSASADDLTSFLQQSMPTGSGPSVREQITTGSESEKVTRMMSWVRQLDCMIRDQSKRAQTKATYELIATNRLRELCASGVVVEDTVLVDVSGGGASENDKQRPAAG